MSHLFICYSRQNQDIVRVLAKDIEALEQNVWFDQELIGGQSWWDQILEKICKCDIFIFAIALEALDSPACRLELKYASDLCKPILPILVADGASDGILPPVLSKIQYVDYRNQNKQSILALNKAIKNLPVSQPLPRPLPSSPDAPISYLGVLKDQTETKKILSFQQQSALVLKLKDGLREIDDIKIVCDLLKQLRKRKDIYSNVAVEIDSVLTNIPKSSFRETMSSRTKPQQKTLKWLSIIIISIIVVVIMHTIIQNIILKHQIKKMVKIPTTVTDNKANNIKWTIQIISYNVSRQHIERARDLAKAIKNMTNYNTFVAKRGDEIVVCTGKFNYKDSNEMKKALNVIRELEYEGRKDFESSYPIQVR